MNQTTTIVGYMPATSAKAHGVEAKPKAKPKDKQSSGQAGMAKASSAPNSPVKSEGPMPPKPVTQEAPKNGPPEGQERDVH